jgi:hypothetical protein
VRRAGARGGENTQLPGVDEIVERIAPSAAARPTWGWSMSTRSYSPALGTSSPKEARDRVAISTRSPVSRTQTSRQAASGAVARG